MAAGRGDWMEQLLSLNESAIGRSRIRGRVTSTAIELNGEGISMKSPRINTDGATRPSGITSVAVNAGNMEDSRLRIGARRRHQPQRRTSRTSRAFHHSTTFERLC